MPLENTSFDMGSIYSVCISSSLVVYTPEAVSSPYYYSSPISAYPYAYAYGAAAYPTAYYGWASNKGQSSPSAAPTQKLTNNQ